MSTQAGGQGGWAADWVGALAQAALAVLAGTFWLLQLLLVAAMLAHPLTVNLPAAVPAAMLG